MSRLRFWLMLLILTVAAPQAAFSQDGPEPARAQAAVAEVSRAVAALRHLEFKKPVPLKLMVRDDLRKLILSLLEREWPKEKLVEDEEAFKMLGLLPRGYDLHKELVDLYSEQVAGLYDANTGQMVLTRSDALKGLTKMLLAHELTHALQDQNFELGRMMDTGPDTIDRDFAISSLAEGDATIVMTQYLMQHGLEDPAALMDALKGESMMSGAKLMNAPPIIQTMMLTPYFSGMAFVNHFREGAGWKEIDAIYRDVPLSSEQILHPSKYFPRRDFPQRIDLDAATKNPVNGNWRTRSQNTLGEVGVRALVETWGQTLKSDALRESADEVAAGWDGDRMILWRGPMPGEAALVWISTWDTVKDADEMAGALNTWLAAHMAAAGDGPHPVAARFFRNEEDGKPGCDVVCVIVCAPGAAREVAWTPKYSKTVVRTAAELKSPE